MMMPHPDAHLRTPNAIQECDAKYASPDDEGAACIRSYAIDGRKHHTIAKFYGPNAEQLARQFGNGIFDDAIGDKNEATD